MTGIWGGPDLANFNAADSTAQPTLPGFDGFILAQFAPLPWALISTQSFNAQDAQMRSVLQEAAIMSSRVPSFESGTISTQISIPVTVKRKVLTCVFIESDESRVHASETEWGPAGERWIVRKGKSSQRAFRTGGLCVR